ncbi:putative transcription factor C2H2 family [Dioscorea sansibarensis]
MNSMGTPEFDDLGKHCSVWECKLFDFMPFTCDRCNQAFCMHHRSYSKHLCPDANHKDATLLICPLCANGVQLVPGQDPNITWESHVNADCDPSNYQKETKKKRCPVPDCIEMLTFSNMIRCRECARDHCLKHRFAPDHMCAGPKKQDTSFPFKGLLRRSQKFDSVVSQTSNNSVSNQNSNKPSRWNSGLLNAVSTVRASAEANMHRLSSMTMQALQRAKDGLSRSGNGAELVEPCPQCLQRFSSISALIEHVERDHDHECNAHACPRKSSYTRIVS